MRLNILQPEDWPPIAVNTHVAEIESIVPYGDKGKYKVNFVSQAREIDSVCYEAGDSALQNFQYTNYNRSFPAKNLNWIIWLNTLLKFIDAPTLLG